MWRLAKSLATLRDEVNGFAPNRSKASDGTRGDPSHQARASRHNENRYGVVTALDLTHDPAGGCDIHAIARRLVKKPHPELAYVISNRQVAKRRTGFKWEPYTGSNGHVKHAHFAVGVGSDSDPLPPYDSTLSWGVSLAAPQTPEDDMADYAAQLNRIEKSLAALAGVVTALADDVPDNIAAEIDEIRRNLRTDLKADGVPADQIEG